MFRLELLRRPIRRPVLKLRSIQFKHQFWPPGGSTVVVLVVLVVGGGDGGGSLVSFILELLLCGRRGSLKFESEYCMSFGYCCSFERKR